MMVSAVRLAAFVGMMAGAGTALADAVADGKAFAQSLQSSSFSNVNSTTAQSLPNYATNPPTAGLYGGASLFGPGMAKITDCAASTPGLDRVANQECAAVNFLARNPTTRPQFTLNAATDPTLMAAHTTLSTVTPASTGMTATAGTGCTQATTTTPAQYTNQVCDNYRDYSTQGCTTGQVIGVDADANYQCDKTVTAFTSQQRQPAVSASSCSYGRQVNIDSDANFQCDQTVNAYTTPTCHKVANVTVTQTGSGMNCTPGQLLASGYNPYDGISSYIYCTGTPNVVTISSAGGFCSGSATVAVPGSVGVQTYNFRGSCGVYYVFAHYISCSGLHCSDTWGNSTNMYNSGGPISFTAPGSNMVVTKTVTWDDQCSSYE